MWRELLIQPAEEIADALTEDSDHGRYPRETRQVFGVGLTSREVAELLKKADAPAADIDHILRAHAGRLGDRGLPGRHRHRRL